MPILNIESFLKDLGLEEIIKWNTVSTGSSQGNSHANEFNKILKEVTAKVNSLEASTVDGKDKISGEIIDIIQLTRRVVYSAIREAENNKAGTAEVKNNKKEENIAKAQKDFDEEFKEKLQDYLLEAEVSNIVNEAYVEFYITNDVAEDKIKPIDSRLMKIFLDAAKKTTDGKVKWSLDDFSKEKIGDAIIVLMIVVCDAAKEKEDGKLDSSSAYNFSEEDIKDSIEMFCTFFDSAFDCVNISSDKVQHKNFCNDIFRNTPDVTAKQISSLGGFPEIKKGVLVSFLRIILYPLTFVVDYLDKKRIYGLDELRLFKDGKEKPRDEKEAKKFQQKRLLDYKAGDPKLKLQEVELDKDKLGKQQYAVLDCFEGDDPPNGTLIVFHGKNADIHTKPLIDNYRSIGKGYRVIMMEYPGFGLSKGPLSKENISRVTYQLFEDAKRKDLIKGNVTVMGEDFGCYYAALLAKKIDEKERGSCKGLMLSELFNSTNSDLSTFGKIASYISDAEHLDTVSVLRSLPKTMPPAFLIPGADCLNSIYLSKKQGPLRSVVLSDDIKVVPVVDYNKDSEQVISEKEGELNKFKSDLLKTLRRNIKRDEAFVYGKKPFSTFLSASATKVDDQKEQGATK